MLANTIYLADGGLLLAHHLRRWPNLNLTLAEWLALAGVWFDMALVLYDIGLISLFLS